MTILLDLTVLGFGYHSLDLVDRQYVNRLTTLITRLPNDVRIVITSVHRQEYGLEQIRQALPESWRHRVIGGTEYAWVRVPRIEEQEIAMYVLQHHSEAPFYIVGPVGPPDILRDKPMILWVKASILDLEVQEALWGLL